MNQPSTSDYIRRNVEFDSEFDTLTTHLTRNVDLGTQNPTHIRSNVIECTTLTPNDAFFNNFEEILPENKKYAIFIRNIKPFTVLQGLNRSTLAAAYSKIVDKIPTKDNEELPCYAYMSLVTRYRRE